MEQVLDPRTRMILYQLMDRQYFTEINGSVSMGKVRVGSGQARGATHPESSHFQHGITVCRILELSSSNRNKR